MIVIFTTSYDLATTLVCKRLNKNFLRINSDIDEIEVVIDINNKQKNIQIILNRGETIVNLEDITYIWYRRGFGITDYYTKNTNYIFNTYFHQNIVTINNFLSEFTSDKALGSYVQEMNVNKLTNLHLARESGMLIPPTIVTSCKNEIRKFSNIHGKTIIKPIKNPFFFEHKGKIVTPSSGILLISDDNELPDKFPLSLFQKYIEKKFEIRIFFLHDDYYAFAMFSQLREDSKIDYRDGNSFLLRNVPYVLPNVLLEKLKLFRKKTQLTTGSIDMIVDEKHDFYFLEVNPSGQFLSLSENCNSYLEKKIVDCLSC